MIDPADKQTQALPLDEQQAKRKRGRPATGQAMTPAEKQRAYRERVKSKQGGSMSGRWIHMFLEDVVRLRIEQDSLSKMIYYGRCSGAIYALGRAEVISYETEARLEDLIYSAMLHSGNPFVDSRNAGPVIPLYIAAQRDCEDA